jgi:hypothetical protein
MKQATATESILRSPAMIDIPTWTASSQRPSQTSGAIRWVRRVRSKNRSPRSWAWRNPAASSSSAWRESEAAIGPARSAGDRERRPTLSAEAAPASVLSSARRAGDHRGILPGRETIICRKWGERMSRYRAVLRGRDLRLLFGVRTPTAPASATSAPVRSRSVQAPAPACRWQARSRCAREVCGPGAPLLPFSTRCPASPPPSGAVRWHA